MSDEVKKYLADVMKAIEEIEVFVGDEKSLQHFQQSGMLRAAVERKIEIIGEAINGALKIEPNLPVTNARKIVDTRNKLIHGYDEVDMTLVWGIVVNHLPLLKSEVLVLISD